MGKINVLDFQVANLIAAGEVVERPASAVKELMENAADAGATEITVEIKKGGISFIRVSDNGSGMSADDLPVAIRRHATSKIRTAADLDGITTLGFRGEALAAIASVSKLRILTKRPEDAMGSVMEVENGRITDLSEAGCRDGTTVIVEELFANVPARRKFLKKDVSEAMAVTATVEKFALSRPDIAVRLMIDGNLKFQTVGDSRILSAIYAVLGRDFASRLIEVDSMTEGIEVTGYIGRPDHVRANRGWQHFFLNGRCVRSKTATAALEQAFESYMEAGKFPCCVLYIYVHPTFVDVNVHPTKLEVKFSNERLVFEGIFCAVRNALMQSTDRPDVLLEPSQMTPEQHSVYNAFVPVYDRIADTEGKKLSGPQIFDPLPDPPDAPQSASDPDRSAQNPDAPITDGQTGRAGEDGRAGAEREKPFDAGFFLDHLPLPDDRDAPPAYFGRLPDPPDLASVGVGADVGANSAPLPPDRTGKPPLSETSAPSDPADPENPGNSEISGDLGGFPAPGGSGEPENPEKSGQTVANSAQTAPETAPAAKNPPDPAQTGALFDPREGEIPIFPAEPAQRPGSGTESGADGGPSGEKSPFLFSLSDRAEFRRAAGNYRMLGVAFNTYIFVEFADHVMIIDKHAAHERILFEQMKQILRSQSGNTQMLLIPMEIKLTAEEFDAALDYAGSIEQIGFRFEARGGSLFVSGIPSLLDSDRASDLLITLCGRLSDGTGGVDSTRDSFFEEALYQGSCKAALKAGRNDGEANMQWIVDVLMKNPDIICCPHGRPVALRLSKHRIEHFFKRI